MLRHRFHGQLHAAAHLHIDPDRGDAVEALRVGGVHAESGAVRGEESVHLFLVGEIDGFPGVGEEKGVENDHHRQVDGLGQAIGLQGSIEHLLAISAVELDPSGIALGEAVGLVGPEIPARAEGAVDFGHDNGQAAARGPVQHFVHQGQPLGGTGSESADPAGGRADDRCHGGMLAFHAEKAPVEGALAAEFCQLFDDMGLRGDRVGRHHLDASQTHGFGTGLTAFEEHFHDPISSMTMAQRGHSVRQTPQPLQ